MDMAAAESQLRHKQPDGCSFGELTEALQALTSAVRRAADLVESEIYEQQQKMVHLLPWHQPARQREERWFTLKLLKDAEAQRMQADIAPQQAKVPQQPPNVFHSVDGVDAAVSRLEIDQICCPTIP
jgi:hypothetical protein